MMGNPVNKEKALIQYRKVQDRIIKAVLAMDEAKKQFEIFKYGPARNWTELSPEWRAVCEFNSISLTADFNDFTC
jgi:hypothetical protein